MFNTALQKILEGIRTCRALNMQIHISYCIQIYLNSSQTVYSYRFAPYNVSKLLEPKNHTRNIPSMGSDNKILCHYIISYKPILMSSVSFTQTSYSERISFSISYSVKTLIPHFEVLIFFETVKVVLNFFNLL